MLHALEDSSNTEYNYDITEYNYDITEHNYDITEHNVLFLEEDETTYYAIEERLLNPAKK